MPANEIEIKQPEVSTILLFIYNKEIQVVLIAICHE